MHRRKHLLCLTALATCTMGAAQAQNGAAATKAANQAWPSRTIRLIVPFPPGGGTDILSRLIAQKLSQARQWTIVADNKPGAGGTIGITEAVRAAPTGYDIVMGQKDNLIIGPWVYKNLPWNPVKDLSAIAHVAHTPVVIATRADSKFKTLADVVQAAKAAPGAISYGSPGSGTSVHLAADLFAKTAHIEINHVPYKGSNPALMDTLAGNVDLLFSSVPSAMSQIKAGKLHPLAVTSAQRSAVLPEVPSVAESGFAGFDVRTWYGLLAPAGTPDNVVATLNAEVNQLLADPEVKKAILAQGAEPLALTAAEFATLVQTEYAQWKDIVQASGVTSQ